MRKMKQPQKDIYSYIYSRVEYQSEDLNSPSMGMRTNVLISYQLLVTCHVDGRFFPTNANAG